MQEGAGERGEGEEGRGMSVRLLIRVFVFHHWAKSSASVREERVGESEKRKTGQLTEYCSDF